VRTNESIAFAILVVVGVSIAITGVIAIAAPQFASEMYGVTIATNDVRAFAWAAGARDIAVGGLLLLIGWLARNSRAIGTTLLIAAIIPTSDAAIVWMVSQPRPALALTLHLSSAVIFAALGIWLRR